MIHDKEASIKSYVTTGSAPDITSSIKIAHQCYSRSNFRLYFTEFWKTENKYHKSNG